MPHYMIERSCTSKVALTAGAARAIVERSKLQGDPLTMYRCPWADDHEHPEKRWHVGHAPSMRALEIKARLIRERQGYRLTKRRAK